MKNFSETRAPVKRGTRWAHLAAVYAATAAMIGGSLAACSTPATDGRIVVDPPDRASFDPVALYLVHRCGTLDCHGNMYRNLRLYGSEGLRLAPTDVPGGNPTTTPEIDQDYRGVVGLEPELMSRVVAAHGAHPETLTFVRKARGTENHAGGALVIPGDDQDTCIVSWLAGSTDSAACARATLQSF